MQKLLLSFFCIIGLFAEDFGLERLIYQIRDPSIEAAHFRETLSRIGELLAMKALSEIPMEAVTLKTLTGATATHWIASENPVLVTILRAGLPLNEGVLRIFPEAHVGFLAMSRDEETLEPKTDYIALPDLRGKVVILSDTMLATGSSLVEALKILQKQRPKKIIVLAAIASQYGVEKLEKFDPSVALFTGAIDPYLNEKGYIIPGLGDAGDRAYGKKYIP